MAKRFDEAVVAVINVAVVEAIRDSARCSVRIAEGSSYAVASSNYHGLMDRLLAQPAGWP